MLDLGCGEGKNAAYLARLGCIVEAWDISDAALNNARAAWPETPVRWQLKDALSISTESRKFDVIIAYGLYHCLPSETINKVINKVQLITNKDGYNIIVAYNDRRHINTGSAHPGFNPVLIPHADYLDAYINWSIIESSDEDLTERHPNNMIQHTHSMTRMLAQNRNEG